MAARDHQSLGPLSQDEDRLSGMYRQGFRHGFAGRIIHNIRFQQKARSVGGQFFSVEIVFQVAAALFHENRSATVVINGHRLGS